MHHPRGDMQFLRLVRYRLTRVVKGVKAPVAVQRRAKERDLRAGILRKGRSVGLVMQRAGHWGT
jgi:hypothetical protein